MAAHRYWRLTGFAINGNGALELSEARLYAAGTLADAAATLTSTLPPTSGVLGDLKDGLATGVVSWPFSAHSSPGFALVWDFGAAGAIDLSGLRLGSGNSATTWPRDIVVQSSDNASDWTADPDAGFVISATYPGALTLTAEPVALLGDPYFSKVSLLLHMDGANGATTFTDSSGTPKTVTRLNTPTISTAQSLYGGASYKGAVSADRLQTPDAAGFDFSTGNWTIELAVRLTSFGGTLGTWLLSKAISTGGSPHIMIVNTTGKLLLSAYTPASVDNAALTSTTSLSLNAWHRLAATRAGDTYRIFIDGVLEGSATNAGALVQDAAAKVNIANTSDGDTRFIMNGHIDELRITKGVARYTANYSVAAAAFPDFPFQLIPQDFPAPARLRNTSAAPAPFVGAAQPTGATRSHLREHTFFDVYNGGIGIVLGTVKEKSTPSNAPLRRRVLLVDERSQMTIRETWSDAVTGNYEFRGVKQGVPYSVLSYDHTAAYRAVVADGQIPKLIA